VNSLTPVGVFLAFFLVSCPEPVPPDPAEPTPTVEQVVRVLDGDTLELAGSDERIRLRGVNAPEKRECGGAEAQRLVASLVASGVVVERSGTGQRGRTLAHLFTPDGRHVQQHLVAAGLAHVATYGEPDRFTESLRREEEAARSDRLGLYGGLADCPGRADWAVQIASVDANPAGDDLAPGAGESVTLTGPPGFDLAGWTVKDTSATHRLTLPPGTSLDGDGRLLVFTSCGEDGPGAIYWCMKGSAVWNNTGDTAFLLDPAGAIISWLEY